MKSSLLWLLAAAAPGVAAANTLSFAEFGQSPAILADGLHVPGVLLGFAGGPALYNGVIGTSGNAVWSVDPVLSGPTRGILALIFDFPVTSFSFDIVLQSIFPLDDSSAGSNGGPAFRVALPDGTLLTGGTAPQPNGFYSEGRFLYSGPPVDSASVAFFQGIDAGGAPVSQFGFDNLSFSAATPEPGTGLLVIAAGLIGIGAAGRRR